MVESSAEKAPSYFCSCGHAESEHRRSVVDGSTHCQGDAVIGVRIGNCPCTGFDPYIEANAK